MSGATADDDAGHNVNESTAEIVALKEKNDELARATNSLTERNAELQGSFYALNARYEALQQQKRQLSEKTAELQDLLAIKRDLQDSLEQQVDDLTTRNEQLQQELSSAHSHLAAIAQERANGPISQSDLLFRYQKQLAVIEALTETLTCPICFSFFGRGRVISLLCGHSFCGSCWGAWEANHVVQWKLSSSVGVYQGAPCPECRTEDVKKGQVRIWALEETIRMVERLQRESEQVYNPPIVIDDSDDDDSAPAKMDEDTAPEAQGTDTKATLSFLAPRQPRPYNCNTQSPQPAQSDEAAAAAA